MESFSSLGTIAALVGNPLAISFTNSILISGAPAAVLAVLCPCIAIGGAVGGKGRREEEDMEGGRHGRHGDEEIQVRGSRRRSFVTSSSSSSPSTG